MPCLTTRNVEKFVDSFVGDGAKLKRTDSSGAPILRTHGSKDALAYW